jgi:hypothetical protein
MCPPKRGADAAHSQGVARPTGGPLSCAAGPVNPWPCGGREGVDRWSIALGARGCGARRPPVALRSTWCGTLSAAPGIRHARCGQPHSRAAFRRVRRLSRLRSGSPPCGGVWRSQSSFDHGHLRASRRPSWWLLRTSSGSASNGFSVSRVREPGTAEGDSACLRPDGDPRMPGTRSSQPLRLASPARPPVRDVTCPAERVIFVPRGIRKRGVPVGRAGLDNVRGPFSIRGAHCLAGQSSGSA